MKNSEAYTSLLSEVMKAPEMLEILLQRVEILEKSMAQSKIPQTAWVTIAKAAKEMHMSESALRQKLRHPTNPLPESIVWKQKATGYSIYVNIQKLGDYL